MNNAVNASYGSGYGVRIGEIGRDKLFVRAKVGGAIDIREPQLRIARL